MPDIQEWPRSWHKFSSVRFFLRSFSQVSVSSWTQARNVYGPHAQVWFAELNLNPQDFETWMPMEAFLTEMGGQSELMRMADSARLEPQYNLQAEGSIVGFTDATFFSDGTGFNSELLPSSIYVVEGAAKDETSIVVGGLPASTARVLRRNDAMQILPNGMPGEVPHYYSIIRDCPTDADGFTRVDFRPGLREGVSAGDTVLLDYPQGLFRLMDDQQGIFERSPGSLPLGSTSLKLIEAII